MKILVADDSATMRKIVEMTFAGEDTEVVAVSDGQSAVAQAQESAPDLILADASMEGTDGYEVARSVKKQRAVPVVVMASQHTPYDTAKGEAAGVDDHVLKPFETQKLIDKVKDLAAKAPAQSPAAGAGAAGPQAAGQQQPAAAKPPQPPPAPAAAGNARQAPPPPPPSAGPGRSTSGGGTGRKPGKATVNFGSPAPQGQPEPSSPQQQASPPQQPSPQQQASGPPAPASTPAQQGPASPASAPSPDSSAAVGSPAPARPSPAAPPSPASTSGEGASAARPAESTGEAAQRVAAAASNGAAAAMADRLREMGLTPEQVEGVLKLSTTVIEQAVWEVVPDLAETIIREELRRLTSDS